MPPHLTAKGNESQCWLFRSSEIPNLNESIYIPDPNLKFSDKNAMCYPVSSPMLQMGIRTMLSECGSLKHGTSQSCSVVDVVDVVDVVVVVVVPSWIPW